MQCMKWFYVDIHVEFDAYHLQQPMQVDYARKLAIYAARGFYGMFALIDWISTRIILWLAK